jgi:UDP-N-acetylmuramoyl-tripeptide--D-alanyl-D-alanine ligase
MSPTVREDGLLVVDDSYNANPSRRPPPAALVALGARRTGRTVAVLGGMAELGPSSAARHRAVGRLARSLGVDAVLSVGTRSYDAGHQETGHHDPGDHHAADHAEALAWLRAELVPQDTVLVKGSRVCGLDRLVTDLVASPSG